MHFLDPQDAAMTAVARQLRSCGTFVAGQFGSVRFHNRDLQDLWARIGHEGGRQLLKGIEDPSETIHVMGRRRTAPISRRFLRSSSYPGLNAYI